MSESQPDASDSQKPVAAVVYNPIKVDADALRAAVERHEGVNGWGETLWFETSVEDPGQGVTKEALDAGATMVLAAGGDGTVRSVAEAVHGSKASLALLPSGTGNLLARNLDLTLNDLDHAVETAFSGDDRAIDVGLIQVRREDSSVEKFAFVVMAGLGIDATMIANTDDDLKKRVGWLAYVSAIAKALRDKNELRMRYNLDRQGNHSVRAHTIIIGNCGSLPANILLLPEAAVDDGLFDIVMLRPKGFVGWVQIIVKIVWENGVLRRTAVGRRLAGLSKEVRALNYVKGKELVVKLDRAHDIELDGDGFGKAIAFRTWVDAGALRVRIPAEVTLEEQRPEDEPEEARLPGERIDEGADAESDLFAQSSDAADNASKGESPSN
ncbi:diacylglycerol kinase [Agreia pratensis]|uniref:diacylglycerol/lipid kinase family protein n=1 Tax=Agreia pratensis TaxID=150121 RepID=UPI00188B5B60|nr:diacylglycerol kinase family protein [Agreia pratensis]MBF4633065.1 diacylglycerol kinase [Agreia pratensis]